MTCDTVFSAQRLPNDIAGCGWYDIANLSARTQQTPLPNQRFHFAIVGAGFTGLACAHRLAQLLPQATIALFDAQNVGCGSAGRNSGFMIDLPHNLASDNYASVLEADRKQIAFNRYGIDFAHSLAKQYGLSQTLFHACGKYHGATTEKAEKHLHEFANSLHALGEDFTLLSADDMAAVTGCRYYQSGLFAPHSAMIQPAAFVNALADYLPDNVTLFENCPVTEIHNNNNGVTLGTQHGAVTADKLLLTNNGHLASFGFFKQRLMHLFLSASMTRELSLEEMRSLGGKTHWGLIPAEPLGSTVRRIGNRLVIRNQVRYSPHLTQTKAAIEKHRAYHQRSFSARFASTLPHVDMQYTWGGHLCLSRNNVHVFGKIAPRMYAAACQNGLGAAKGSASGALLAEYVVDCQQPLHQYLLDMAAPSRLPPEPLMTIGAKTVLWAKQRLAGSDL